MATEEIGGIRGRAKNEGHSNDFLVDRMGTMTPSSGKLAEPLKRA